MSTSLWPVDPLAVKQVEGFASTKVESVALAAHGTRLFAGTSDGLLFLYECRRDTPAAVRSGSVELVQISQLLGARAANRDKVRVPITERCANRPRVTQTHHRFLHGRATEAAGCCHMSHPLCYVRWQTRVSSLVVVDEWRALLGIMDNCLTVYDTTTW
jgi:hypothetical protein